MNRDDPFAEIERLFDELTAVAPGGASLAVDVLDAGDAFEVTADLPGYDTGDIDVKLLDGRRLRIAAERDTETEHGDGRFVTRERRRQSVSRTVSLPEPVDESDPEAAYSNGVLTVRLPKAEPAEDEGTDIPVG